MWCTSPDPSRKIRLLLTTADKFWCEDENEGYYGEAHSWTPTLRAILAGTRDTTKQSPLSALRAHEDALIRNIYAGVANEWAKHVKLTIPAPLVGNTVAGEHTTMRFTHGRHPPGGANSYDVLSRLSSSSGASTGFEDGFVAFSKCGQVEFPEPAGRNGNMMPFILGDKDSLPDDLECYYTLIENFPCMVEDVGNMAYLTVHESYVGPDDSTQQQRSGLHIESAGLVGSTQRNSSNTVTTSTTMASSFMPAKEHYWGMGMLYGPDRYKAGIYIVSSVSDACEVWDALIDKRVPTICARLPDARICSTKM
jgi:hypothetical protein